MKKIIAATMAIVMAASMTRCGSVDSSSSAKPGANVSDIATQPAEEPNNYAAVLGGWTAVNGDTSLAANKDAKTAFEKATSALAGMEYEPLAVVATQIVSGTNYCILCRGTATVPGAEPSIELVYVYENLQGGAEITGSKTIIDDEVLDGGWAANSGDVDIAKNPDVKKAFEKASETMTGADLEPVAYLGCQVVAGSNYLLLCKSTATVPGAETEFVLATVYAALEGGAEIADVDEIVFGEFDKEAGSDADEGNSQIANPWAGYETVEEAAKAAGVEVAAPEALGGNKMFLVQAMEGLVEVAYGDGKEYASFRKGTGSDDISGDYNTYEEVSETDISGVTVTLRGNDGKVYGALWSDGEYSYAYCAGDGVTSDTAEADIAEIIAANAK